MAKAIKKKALKAAIEEANLEEVQNLLSGGGAVDFEFIQQAQNMVSDLEQEYWDDKAFYKGMQVENSDIYKILKLLEKAPKPVHKIKAKFYTTQEYKQNPSLLNIAHDEIDKALSRGEVEQTKAYLAHFDKSFFDGYKLAHPSFYFATACEYPTTEMIDVLLELGFDPNTIDKGYNNYNALHRIISSAGVKNIIYLVQKGCDCLHYDRFGRTALHYCKIPMIKAAKSLGLDLNVLTKKGTWIKEIDYDKEERIKEEVQESNFYYKYEAGRTPLICAAFDDKQHAINLLIKFGVKMSIKDANDSTALDYALSYPKTGAFVKGGINKALAKEQIKGFKTLSFATMKSSYKKLQDILDEGDPEKLKKFLNKYDYESAFCKFLEPLNDSAWNFAYLLYHACEGANSEQMLETIKETTKINFNYQDFDDKDNVLHYFAKYSDEEYFYRNYCKFRARDLKQDKKSLTYLVQNGASFSAINECGYTPFLSVIFPPISPIRLAHIQFFLELGANANDVIVCDENVVNGYNALMFIAGNLRYDRKELKDNKEKLALYETLILDLKKYGIDVNYTNNGKNAIDILCENFKEEEIKDLKSWFENLLKA
ncbi:hypothetical protein [Campylobacter sp. CCS1377]|uniref:Ankyrin repeat domain-containing protein n=1 Tax=Campylobacter sp. CCS1377 TaxID=3158229 RepID=A0AAU7E9R9_9BACT